MKSKLKFISLLILILHLSFLLGVYASADSVNTPDKPDNVICIVELRLKSGAIENYNIYAGKDVDDEKQIEDTLKYLISNDEVVDILKIDGVPLAETKYHDYAKNLWDDEPAAETQYKNENGFDIIKKDNQDNIIIESKQENTQRVNVLIDGQPLVSDVKPYIENGRIMVPLKFMADLFNANTGYKVINKDLQIIWVEKNLFYVYMKIGDIRAFKNNEMLLMDTAPVIKENRTFVPLSFIRDLFGYSIEYDSKTNTAKVCTNKEVKK